MRALFYNHSGRASGAERVLILALQHLDRTAVEPVLVCPEGQLADEVRHLGMPVKTISELRARFTLWPHKLAGYAVSLVRTGMALRSEIRNADAEIVHANSPRAGIAALFATVGTGLPVIWHVHDELKPHPITSVIRRLAALSDRCSIVAVSAATGCSFAGDSETLKDRVTVIHNAVDVSAIDSQRSSGSIREKLGLDPDDFLFGIVGQITPRKGQLELVDAFSKAAADMPHAKLLVIGSPIFDHDDVYQQQVFELTSSLGMSDRVVFLGHRNDATDIIKQLDTLVINSKSEAFVMVGIEAMACKTAVMATDVGGTREMIEDGVNGLLIPFGDEAALLSALKKMYADAALRQLFVERSREMVEKELTIERFAGEFHNALFSAAAGKAQASTAIERAVNAVENP